MRKSSIGRAGALALVVVAFVGVALYVVSLQTSETMRFEIGSMDWDYLADPTAFEKRNRMDGPIRRDDGSVDVIQFYGRVAYREAAFRLPYHARRSPLRLTIRSHRFGLGGVVALTVNGELIDELVFGETSYPWAGIEVVVPESVAERGPLLVELRTIGGKAPPSHLPEDTGVGVDWIEVTPLSEGVSIVPPRAGVVAALAIPLLAFGFWWLTGAGVGSALVVAFVAAGIVAISTHFAPAPSLMAITRLWAVFPMGLALWLVLGRVSLAQRDRAFLVRMFALALLAHSVLIFYPNHAPPDIGNHEPQVEWLSSLDLTFDEVYRFSSSSDPFDDGHVRPHFGVEYGAPYPPLFYLMTFAVTFVHGDIRFLIEFLSVTLAALLMVPAFLIARRVWDDVALGYFAVGLLVLEISIWHHAHRVHAPGTLGEIAVFFWLYFLLAHREALVTRRGLIGFAVLSMVTALSYPASLVQISIVSAFLVIFWWFGDGSERALCRRFVVALAFGFAGAFSLYYAPYAIQAARKSAILLDRQAYDPPAIFYFLRNQMRDTVRILMNGYPLYVGLSAVGFVLLFLGDASSYHKKILAACGLTYVTMLVLKDPIFFPMIFLHAKEDLFYAPLACLLGGLVLAALWRRGLPGRVSVIAIFSLFFVLQVRDQALNHDTLHDQAVQRAVR